jgi:ribosomal protein S18 acetylase RimI-like enzyme
MKTSAGHNRCLAACSNHDFIVRAGFESDYPAIARLQQQCPEAAQWPVGDYFGYEMLVAVSEVERTPAEIAGFCAWRHITDKEAELLNLAVDPARRRQGVGSALLECLTSVAPGDIFLEVAETNAPAIALYQRHGWRQTGLRQGYYLQGSINAIVMKKSSW